MPPAEAASSLRSGLGKFMVKEQQTMFDEAEAQRTSSVIVGADFSPESTVSLIAGDALAACQRLPSEMFQLIISSPPYNIGKDYEEVHGLDEYLSGQGEVIRELVRLLKPTGSICWQVGNFIGRNNPASEVYPLDIYFYPLFKSHGLQLRNRVVWHFGHGLHAQRRFSGRYETLLWFTKTDKYTFNLDRVRVPSKYPGKRAYKGDNKGLPSGNPLGKNPSDFWSFDVETFLEREWSEAVWEIPNVKSNHPEKTSHPCQFPVELVERCVLAMTNEDDWVLDPYGGVGTAAVAAIKHARRAVCIDRETNYLIEAQKRIQMLMGGKLNLRPMGKPIHEPSGKVAQVPIEWERR
jgi:adenine-specific DNA-methyltransferase